MPQVSVRNRLVEHAEDVFRRKGFGGASIQDITQAANVPKGSFYNHFDSKQDLAVEIILRHARTIDLSTLEADGSALERLHEHLIARLEHIRASGIEFGCLLGNFASESITAGERVRAAVHDVLVSWAGSVSVTIAEGQTAGEITTDRPASALAAFLLDWLEGATLRAKIADDHGFLTDEVGIALRALRA
ncbi:TetR/AcrR family transcriptional regulator [Streptomyces phaeofaciens JCM 4814]|uniref:TetR family transcriptional regulator n=1 Tax=Streptomyces phaeofaciens TaxID=68254 RepID=A0A918HRK6_9ACTN|nr:TetR/AcrR family transcriptional regulator [Streptomyces phaeofaciens]GGT98546.1 TetR family transcriptional regulator [Streptomyces phaeofaciens]